MKSTNKKLVSGILKVLSNLVFTNRDVDLTLGHHV